MCFSAGASFGAGAVLSVIGIASARQAKSPSAYMFSAIPLLFAVQQTAEGFVWLSLTRPAYAACQVPATYLFLFFAQVVWPLWVPLSIAMPEKKQKRKTVLKILVAAGIVVSGYLAFCLFSYPVEAKNTDCHIVYSKNYPDLPVRLSEVFYMIATVVPSLFSSVRRMWFLGVSILVSYIITEMFYKSFSISVWCFFASAISISVFVILHEMNKRDKKYMAWGEVDVPA